jgi:hypothetical protein
MACQRVKQSFIKSLRSKIGESAIYKGQELDPDNAVIALEGLAIWACIIADNVCVDDRHETEMLGRIMALYIQIQKEDLFDVLTHLDFTSQFLLSTVEKQELRSYEQFKAALVEGDVQIRLLGTLAGLLKSHACAWFTSRDVTAFAKVREVLEFPKRLTLRIPSLSQVAYDAWFDVERGLKPVVPEELIQIAREWFPIEDTAIIAENFVPHHGSGSVFEGNLPNGEKYLRMGLDETLNTVCVELGWNPKDPTLMQQIMFLNGVDPRYGVPLGETYDFNLKRALRGLSVKERIELVRQIDDTSTKIAAHKLLFVPKSYKTYRSVSMEPLSYQFFEEGAAWAIFQYLKDPNNHCPLRYHYCVDTDDKNREMAQRGSVDGEFATMDFSSASDTVSLHIVEQCLSETCLWPFVSLRTKYAVYIERDDYWNPITDQYIKNAMWTSCFKVDKFAPMGSALCFPIETIIFALVAEAAVRSTPGCTHAYRVYGDDGVIPTPAVPAFLEISKKIGLKPNMEKSFFNAKVDESTDYFRESCGGEYLNGIEVTPLRLSRKFRGLTAKAEDRSLPQLVSLANDLFERPFAHQLIVDELINQSQLPILFDEDGVRGLKSVTPTNYRLPIRWNNDWQIWEVRALVLRTKRRQLRHHEEAYLGEFRLYEYFRLAKQAQRRHLLFPEDVVDERVDPYSTELELHPEWVERPVPDVQ